LAADAFAPAAETVPAASTSIPAQETPATTGPPKKLLAARTVPTTVIVGLARSAGSRRRWHPPRTLIKAISPIVLIALWWLASSVGWLSSHTLASPGDVLEKAAELTKSGELQEAILASASRVGLGLFFGLTAAVVAALISGLFRVGEDVIDAPLQMLRTVPVVGLIPLLIIWFGIGDQPKLILIALGVFFPLYLNLFAGIRGTDPALIEAGRTLGLHRFGLVRNVVLPAAVPNGLVGLRYSIGVSWLILVFAETINATTGIGYLINEAREFFQTDTIVLCLVLYAVLGLIADIIVRLLERVLLAWRPTFTGT
jgi:sulfonate transport system permease protein